MLDGDVLNRVLGTQSLERPERIYHQQKCSMACFADATSYTLVGMAGGANPLL